MTDYDKERGMVTAEYTVGTLGAVMIAVILYRFGLLGQDSPWFDNFRQILQRSLGWGLWRGLFDGMPRYGINGG